MNEKQVYTLIDSCGNRQIVREKENGEYEYLSDYIGFLAWDILDDLTGIIRDKKSKEGTEIELKINVLNALTNAASLKELMS